MLDADHPITKSDEDRLNRAIFAKYLARSMLDYEDTESLVIGLYGGFGSGKTSILNLVIEELNTAATHALDNEKPIILNFNPWSYSGQHQLIYSFFRRLSSTLRSVDYLENRERIIHLLELYVSFFTKSPIPKSLRSKRSLPDKLTLKGKEDIRAWESGRDLTLVKMELNELLRNQKHKIIIIIDNISQLQGDEVRQLFQIVKSMGNYASTIYLLSLDKEQAIRALNKIDEGSGKGLLEKVIQLPFEIPPILQQDLENIFSDKMSSLLENLPLDTWNKEYWADIYYHSIRFFFKNCRDIIRYVNTLGFSYSRMKDIVNPIDFFTLTAIEVFMPQVYFGIRDNKDLFTDLFDPVYILNKNQIQKDKLRAEEIINRAHPAQRQYVLDALKIIFPRLRHLYEPQQSFYHSETIARKWRRICSPDLFDAYFRLSMQPGQLTDAEFDIILKLSSENDAFDHALARLNQDDLIPKLLDKLDSKVIDHLNKNEAQHIINALLDNGDLFPQKPSHLLSLDCPMRIHRIIHRLLQIFESHDQRFLSLQTAISEASKSIYIIVHELKEQAREHHEDEDTFLPLEFRDLTPQQIQSLCKLTASRIAAWAQSGRLSSHPQLLALLSAWQDWGNDTACNDFVSELVISDRGLLQFLTLILNPAIMEAMTLYQKNPAWEKYLSKIAAFISPDRLIEHAKILFEGDYFEKLKEQEQLALMIFLDLVHAKTNKKIPQTTV